MDDISVDYYGSSIEHDSTNQFDFDYTVQAGGKVVNGRDAIPGQFPYLISLQRANARGKYGQHCGATVIHPLILLTAAHCLGGLRMSQLKAVSGEQHLTQPTRTEQARRIIQNITHPAFDPVTKVNDIALLMLDQPLKFDQYTRPIRMAIAKPTVSKASIAGWGVKNKKPGAAASPILQFANINLKNFTRCKEVWTGLGFTVTEKHLCAGGAEADTCKGDSGGPLTCRSKGGEHYVCGIVSWGQDKCIAGSTPGIYTDISAYREWIVENVHEMLQSPAVPPSPVVKGCGLSTSYTSDLFCATCALNREAQMRPFVATYNVQMDIRNAYSSTRVISTMFNPHKANSQDVTFSILFPQSALISEFSMTIDGIASSACAVEAQSSSGTNATVQTQRQQQQQQQQQLVLNDVASGIVESSIPNFNRFNFTTTIGNLTLVTFTLTYEELLVRRRGVYKQAIHIDSDVVGEAQDCNVSVSISDSGIIKWLRTFGIDSSREVTENANVEKEWNETTGIVNWRPAIQPLNTKGPSTQRLELQFDLGSNETTGEAGQILIQDDYFVHTLPSRHLERFGMPPKHFIFVLDTSNPMSGATWEHIKGAMNSILDGLARNLRKNYFNIIAFDQKVTVWTGVSASSTGKTPPIIGVSTRQIGRAKDFINSLRPKTGGGDDGWDLHAALQTALKISNPSGRTEAKSPLIILLTSSNRNSSSSSNNNNAVIDPDQIQTQIATLNKDQAVPIFSLAVADEETNTDGLNSKPNVFPFLQTLSAQNHGLAVKIPFRPDTPIQLKDAYLDILSFFPLPQLNYSYSYPSAFNLTEPAVMNKFSTYIPKGSNVIVAGKIGPAELSGSNVALVPSPLCNNPSQTSNASIQVVITARSVSAESFRVFETSQLMPTEDNSNNTLMSAIAPTPTPPSKSLTSFVPRIWAYLKVKELLEELEKLMRINEGNVAVEEITEYASTLAANHGFLTPLTSYVVIKPDGKNVRLEDHVNGGSVFQGGRNGTVSAAAAAAANSRIHISTSKSCS